VDRLAHEVVRPGTNRTPSDAVATARRRLEEQRFTVGVCHPDYASGLIQLALLLIMHGDPTEAEPLLREALDIRKETLGDRHPDYATCLSSLAGLLWARGDLDGAEPLLREALEIRCEVLGDRHPKSIVSLNSLDQLLQAKSAWPGAKPGPRDKPSAEGPNGRGHTPAEPRATAPQPAAVAEAATVSERPVDVEQEPEPPSPVQGRTAPPTRDNVPPVTDADATNREELAREVSSLRDEFTELGDRLARAAEPITDGGPFPPNAFVEELRVATQLFQDVRARALALAGSVGVPDVDSRELANLDDLELLLDEVVQVEEERARHGEACRQALSVLDRLLGLAHADRAEFAPLADCQDGARELARQVSEAPHGPLNPETLRLVEGTHPLLALLTLAEDRGGSSDDAWAEALDVIESHFGKPLAVAAARAKIVPAGDRAGVAH
jgi:hypothetical protein